MHNHRKFSVDTIANLIKPICIAQQGRAAMTKSKLHREIEDILRATGLPYSFENGSRHDIVMLAGQRVGTLSHGRKERCDSKKIAASIRQYVRRIKREENHA